jgi:AmmeMemoRadiSam system protein B
LKIRNPSQAGTFYPNFKESLNKEIENCFLHKNGPGSIPKPTIGSEKVRKLVGIITPHAGYMFSGPIAAFSYKALIEDGIPKIAVIIGPNHTGIGSGVSIMTEGEWKTPLGNVRIDLETAKTIANSSTILDIDDSAHKFEHSIEVQLPFLQYFFKDQISIVPICMMMQDLETSLEIANIIYNIVKDKDAVIIASTDMTHYEPQIIATKKDKEALNHIIKLDVEGFYHIIESNNMSICGYGPIAVLIHYAKLSGVSKGNIAAYHTSGDITGDTSAVVGYSSVIFKK